MWNPRAYGKALLLLLLDYRTQMPRLKRINRVLVQVYCPPFSGEAQHNGSRFNSTDQYLCLQAVSDQIGDCHDFQAHDVPQSAQDPQAVPLSRLHS